MARNYGRTNTGIWTDGDFLALPPEARFTYTMLFNQANITAAGTLPLTVRRWARMLGYSVEVTEKALRVLEERAYLVSDEDTEELFIRSFVKWDGGLGNDKRRQAIQDSAAAVVSSAIRDAVARELARYGLSKPDANAENQSRDRASDGYRSPIDTPRVVVTEGEYNSNPQPSTHEGEPTPISGGPRPDEFCPKHMPDGTDENCGRCAGQRKRLERWDASRPQAAAAARAAARSLISNCGGCDENGMVLDLETHRPLGRCSHGRTA